MFSDQKNEKASHENDQRNKIDFVAEFIYVFKYLDFMRCILKSRFFGEVIDRLV